MQINANCIRNILLIAETCSRNDYCHINELVKKLPQYYDSEIYHACDVLYEKGYIKAVIKMHTNNPSIVKRINGITESGLSFLENIRSEGVWKKLKRDIPDFSSIALNTRA